MRKNTLSTLAVMGGCILLLSSCEKREDGLVIDNTTDGKIFTAVMPTVEEHPESKTSTTDGRNIIWDEADFVSVFNGINVCDTYMVKQGEDGKTFTTLEKIRDGDLPVGKVVRFAANIAYFPDGMITYTGTGSNHSLRVSIPHTQNYTPNSFGSWAMPMVAVTTSKDDNNLIFKNLFGLIKLQLKGSEGIDNVKSITIYGNNEETLSGEATVSCSNTTAPTISFEEGDDVYDYVKLNCAEGVAVNEESATSFWIALPPTTFSKGITVLIELGDGRIFTKSTNKTLAITRSMVTPMAEIALTIQKDELNISDLVFKAYLLREVDMDNDGILTIKDAQAWNESSLDKSFNLQNKDIASLKGMEYFTALSDLDCSSTSLSELDLSKNTALARLDCEGIYRLTNLDVSKNTALTELRCGRNLLTTLDLSKNLVLTTLHCEDNQLTALDVSKNIALEDLYCNGNKLTTLDVSKNIALVNLYCHENKLTTLNVSKNTALEDLSCEDNQLTTLDLSSCVALISLQCSRNQLTTLDVSMTKINTYYNSTVSLGCYMSTLKTLYLKTGWSIFGINASRLDSQIHPNTVIEYKD